jgi:hypothetical protein
MKFLRKRKKDEPDKNSEQGGIIVTETMKLYLIRQTQDRKILGTVLLSDSQYNLLMEALDGKGVIFTRE